MVSAVFLYTFNHCISCDFQYTKAPVSFYSSEFRSPFCSVIRTGASAASATEDELVVHLKTGSVRGGSQKSIFSLNLEYFLGIPYAAAPVGDLRFSPPQLVQPWEGVRDATKYGARCPQNEDSFPRNITVGMFKAFRGPGHTTREEFENAASFVRLGLPSALIFSTELFDFKLEDLKTLALRFRVDGKDF